MNFNGFCRRIYGRRLRHYHFARCLRYKNASKFLLVRRFCILRRRDLLVYLFLERRQIVKVNFLDFLCIGIVEVAVDDASRPMAEYPQNSIRSWNVAFLLVVWNSSDLGEPRRTLLDIPTSSTMGLRISSSSWKSIGAVEGTKVIGRSNGRSSEVNVLPRPLPRNPAPRPYPKSTGPEGDPSPRLGFVPHLRGVLLPLPSDLSS